MNRTFQRGLYAVLFALFALVGAARADAIYLLAEPYGSYGGWNPTGHAAVYLTNICAASPTQLRLCRSGETGAVISRYHRVAGFDWVAVPLVPYFYAVERVEDIPATASDDEAYALRDAYRHAHLQKIAPDLPDGSTPPGDWYQLVGASYLRTFYGFRIATTLEQDEAFIALYNDQRNRTRYSLFRNNCANFAADVMNFYAPRAVRASLLADLGVMTPKQAAKSLVKYAKKHPEAGLEVFRIPQVPGTTPSKPTRGIMEGLLKSKRYALPLTVIQPWVGGTVAVAYFTAGRFNPRPKAEVLDIAAVVNRQSVTEEVPESGGTLSARARAGRSAFDHVAEHHAAQ